MALQVCISLIFARFRNLDIPIWNIKFQSHLYLYREAQQANPSAHCTHRRVHHMRNYGGAHQFEIIPDRSR